MLQRVSRERGTVFTLSPPPSDYCNAADEEERARLLAVTTKESGAWLRALPVTALGLRMDDSTVRVVVGLRLGTRICGAHTCQHCEAEVSGLGRHSLSCKKSVGRFQRHTVLNDIMKYTLSAAHVPSRLEPTGLLRSDGKRPDGVTLAPWKCGQLLVWDATCPDTFAPLYSNIGAWACGSTGGRQKGRQVQRPAQESLVLPALYRDHGSDGSKISGAGEGGWQEDPVGDRGATVQTFCSRAFWWQCRGGTVPQC